MDDQKSSGSDYIQAATTSVEGIQTVRLYQETWLHIVDGHPEVSKTGQEGVISAASNPTVVFRSETSPSDTLVFVNEEDTHEGHALHVPGKLLDGTTAVRIKTAFYRTSKPSWEVVWRKDQSNA